MVVKQLHSGKAPGIDEIPPEMLKALGVEGQQSFPQVKEVKYLGVWFTSEGMMEREMNRRVGAAGAVLHVLHRTVVTKRELSQKAKLSIYRSIFVPTLTYGH